MRKNDIFRAAVQIGTISVIVGLIAWGCGNRETQSTMPDHGSTSLTLTLDYRQGDIEVFSIAGSSDEKVVRYWKFRWTDPQTQDVRLLTFDEADQLLSPEDVVIPIGTEVVAAAQSIPEAKVEIKTVPDAAFTVPFKTVQGGSSLQLLVPDCRCAGCRPSGDHCECTWGAIKSCFNACEWPC